MTKPPLLLACFFLSGVSGLVYEVLWTRILGLSFGHTVWALTTVVAVFMGGLALGSRIFGKVADRSPDPVRLYALLELGIGLYCLAGPRLLDLARDAHLLVHPSTDSGPASRVAVEFLLCAAALIVPTTLMGGTVPAMSRAFIATREDAGARFGTLYGVNTLGAALGAFLAGYWLLPSIGTGATNLLAALVNLGIGIGLLLSRRAAGEAPRPPDRPGEESCREGAEPGGGEPDPPVSRALLRAAFLLTGAASMLFQIAWVRSIILVIGSSTYAYSAILVTFLLGIALGSFLLSRVRIRAATLAAILLSGIALSAFLLLPSFDLLPGLFLALFRAFPGTHAYVALVQFLVVSAVVAVPAAFMGMTLPCLAGMALRDGRRIGTDIGGYYALNTVGAILGSALTGFLLVPSLGAQATIAAGIAVELALSAFFLRHARPARLRRALPAFILLGVSAFLLPSWNRGIMGTGASAYAVFNREPGQYFRDSRERSRSLLYFREGISSTVAVFGERGGDRWFTVNGKTDGGTGDLMPSVRVAMIPMLLRPGARRVAVVGLGTGATAGTAGMFGDVESIDIVELEPAVAEAARFFDAENAGILGDPRARLHIDDGRSFLDSRGPSYDVIVSEPSNPWIAGVSNLFTAEYFRSARARLSPGGVFGLWIQDYSFSPDSYRMIVRTFLDAFPDATLWQAGYADTVLVGRKGGPPSIDAASLRERLRSSPALVAAFGKDGEFPLEPLFDSFLLDPAELRAFAGDGPRNTDDRNRLEFDAPKSLYRHAPEGILRDALTRKETDLPPFLEAPGVGSPSGRLAAGERLLLAGSPALAAWQFGRLPSFAPRFAGPPGPGRIPEGGIEEDFERPTRLPFLPATGAGRPSGGNAEAHAHWLASQAHFTRVSGVVPGAGAAGSAGLLLRGTFVSPAGYLVPLEVEPGAEYEVRFRMKAGARSGGAAGVRLDEFDTREDDGAQPANEFLQAHLVRRSMLLERRGESGWSEHRVRFRSSGGTSLVRLFFFLGGGPGDRAAFDGIAIARLPGRPG